MKVRDRVRIKIEGCLREHGAAALPTKVPKGSEGTIVNLYTEGARVEFIIDNRPVSLVLSFLLIESIHSLTTHGT